MKSLTGSVGSAMRSGLVGVAVCAAATAQIPTHQTPPQPDKTNVLIIVGDDVGLDMIGAWGVSPDAPPTPTLDTLANGGVRFTHAYANPLCSPTRATIVTGRYGFRTQIGYLIYPLQAGFALQLSEVTFAEAIGVGGYNSIATAAIGKWHLGSASVGGAFNANLQGFEWFSGTLGNFANQDYYTHRKYINGVQAASTTYATTEQVDDAMARINTMPEPWCLYLAFNAPHEPFHVPPSNLHTYTLSGDPELTPQPHFRAAMQAMDTEIGRLLESIPPAVLANTTILFVGDNGTPGAVVTPPFDPNKSKATVYEGGVRVPLLAWGKHVVSPGRVCDALVNTVDMFPTVLDLFRDQTEIAMPKNLKLDGVSLMPYLTDPQQAPQRAWVYSDHFIPNGPGPYTLSERMLRDQRWKLIERDGSPDEFYDIGNALIEAQDLLAHQLDAEQLAAYQQLKLQMVALTQN